MLVDVGEVIQVHRRYVVEIVQIRWLDSPDGCLRRATRCRG
ncbi:MAG: hypothetical protein ACRD0B_02985 [Acidimicrobiales bacterium]